MASIDAIAKRYHPAIVCGLLGLIAYFQGSGIGSLIAEHLPMPPDTKPPVTDPDLAGTPKPKTVTVAQKSGAGILARNAFDSVTGPISTRPAPPVRTAAPPVAKPTNGEPPSCPNGNVMMIAGTTDPAFGFAVISMGKESKLRRVGDEIDGRKVEAIEGKRVVLATGDDRCQLKMHELGKPGVAGGAVVPPTPSEEGAEEAATPRATRGGTSNGIRKVSATEYVLTDNGAQKVQQMQQAFMKSAKIVDGQGLRLYRAARATILGSLGLRQGDIVKSINGMDMSSLDQSTQAYAGMRTAKNIQIAIERDGKPVMLDYTVE